MRLQYYQLLNAQFIQNLRLDTNNDYIMVSFDKLQLYQIKDGKMTMYHRFSLEKIFKIMNDEYHEKYDQNGYINVDTGSDGIRGCDAVLAFKMCQDNMIFIIYYAQRVNRLFAAYIRLLMNQEKEPELIDYTLLDGKIGRVSSTTLQCYHSCHGIEQIYDDKDKKKYWMVYCEHFSSGCFHMTTSEARFKIDASNLKVIYGKLRKVRCYSDFRYKNH